MPTVPQPAPNVPEMGNRLLDRLSEFQLPSPQEYLASLSDMGPIWAFILVACGLVYLLNGWKMFKMLVVLNSAAIGCLVGIRLGQMQGGEHTPIFAGAAGGLLLACLAWPLMKYAISLMGGLTGSFLGYGLWNYVAAAVQRQGLAQHAWVGALIGLITLGLLAFVIFRLVVVVLTSVQGSIMTVSGLLCLLLKYPPIRESIEPSLTRNIHLLPLLIGVPAVIGFALQEAAAAKKAKKKKGGDGGG